MPGDVWTSGLFGTAIPAADRWTGVIHGAKMSIEAAGATLAAPISADASLVFEFAFLSLSAGNRTGMVACLQVDGVDSSLIITTAVTGFFETAAGNTVTVTPTQTVAWRFNGGSGGSTNMTPVQIGARVTHASKFYTRPGCAGGASLAVSSVTRFVPSMGGIEFVSTESAVQSKWPSAGTAEKISFIVTVNARLTASSAVFRRGGADAGSSVSIPSGVTGAFEGSLSQSISAGDLINFAVTTSTGGAQALTISGMRLLVASTANNTNACGAGPATSLSAPRYSLPVGDFSPAISLGAATIGRIRRAGRLTTLGVRITLMSGGAVWEVAVKTSADVDTALVLSLAASTTGWFDMAAGTPLTVATTDLFTINSRRVSGSGNMTIGLVVVGSDEPSGGTTFTKSVAGNLSFVGALTRQLAAKRTLAGSLSLTSAIGRVKSVTRALTGVLSFTSTLGRLMAFKRTLTGQLRLQGVVKGQVSKRLTGVLSFAGALRKGSTKSLAGTLRFTSTLGRLKSLSKVLAGTLSSSSTLTRFKSAGKLLAGVLAFQGAVTKRTARTLAGALSFQGALARRLALNRALTGILSFTSVLGRVKIPGGAVFFKTLTGILSFGSTLTREYIDNPEPVAGPDPWLVRMRRRWGGK